MNVVSEGVHIFHAREKKKDPGCSTTETLSDSNETEKYLHEQISPQKTTLHEQISAKKIIFYSKLPLGI
jgi:hypothetical protein